MSDSGSIRRSCQYGEHARRAMSMEESSMNPNDLPMFVVIGIGGMLCAMGFVALLLQKLYLDPAARKGKVPRAETVLKLPGFGEVSTTYPALAFLVVGAALVPTGMATTTRPPEKVPWHVVVHVESGVPLGGLIEAGVAISPSYTRTLVDRQARTITIDTSLDKGLEFEAAVEAIDLTVPGGSGRLDTVAALQAFKATHQPAGEGHSGLVSTTVHTRVYRLALTRFPTPFEEAQP